jgi:hypothetical protein
MDTGDQNTISGLLRKRGQMLANMAELREQIAGLSALRRAQARHGSPWRGFFILPI